MPAPPLDLIGVRETGALLDRDKKTILRWARDGTLPLLGKLPGKNGAWLFDRAEVMRLADRLRREPPNGES